MVVRLTLSYVGTAYAGWQRQTNARAVQQVVEEALQRLLGEPVRIFGASRTDAGVHARGQTAHLDLPRPFPLRGLLHGLHPHLPADIRILAVHRMADGFHARKSALGKEYLYRIWRGRVVPPLEAPFATRVERPLDVDPMRRAAALLAGVHDFTAFALSGGSHGQPFRRLFAVTVHEHGKELRLRFSGAGFLRGMVRCLVGTLIEIGQGHRDAGEMSELLRGRPREEAGPTAAARGLVLERVMYPSSWRPSESYEP